MRTGVRTEMVCVVIAVGALVAFAGSGRADEGTLLRGLKLTDSTLVEPVNALGPIKRNGTWTQEDAGIVANGTAAPWTIRTAGSSKWTDYRLRCDVTIRRAAPKADYPITFIEYDRYLPREWFPPTAAHTGQHRYRYYAGEFDWGSDAAVFVRYQDREDCYRVQLSSEYQELILWHGVGGYLQVVPCELKQGHTYPLEVRVQGTHIQVLVSGKPKIDYWHRTLPTRSGKIGLGVYRSTVAFDNVSVTELPPLEQAVPAHRARLRTRLWRTLRWVFDGDEPICLVERYPTLGKNPTYLDRSLMLHFIKLCPGYRPTFYAWIAMQYTGGSGLTQLVGDVHDIATTGEGTERLELKFDTKCKKDALRIHHTDVITYDRVRGAYRHDMTYDVRFLAEVKARGFEFIDPLTYNNKFPGRGVKYGWLPSGHVWGLFLGEKGQAYRHPLSQSLALLGQNGWVTAAGRNFWMLYPDRAVCPVWEHDVEGSQYNLGVCHWGYDFHQSVWYGNKPKVFNAGDKKAIRYAITGYPMTEAEGIFRRSKLHPRNNRYPAMPNNPRVQAMVSPSGFVIPVCDPAGTDFTRLHNIRRPYVGWQFCDTYAVDDTVGHGDRYSLRLDGPAKTSATMYHHMLDGYAKRYVCTVWLKTKGTTGTGPVVTLKYPYGKAPGDTVVSGMTGDSDWQRIRFVTKVPVITPVTYDASMIAVSLEGKGTVWVDDFSLRPVAEGETVAEDLPDGAKITRWPGWTGLETK